MDVEDVIRVYQAALIGDPCPVESKEARAAYKRFADEIADNPKVNFYVPHDWQVSD